LRRANAFATIAPVETFDLPRGTVTFLFTDIEGSTDLARQLGAAFSRVRSEHRRVLREAFDARDGHEMDTAGDGFFIAFERAGDAVAAAVDAQRALVDSQVRVRMGLHSAEPYLDDDGYVGVGVNRAARICAAGHGGQILLSNATAGIVEDLGLEGVDLQDLGEHRLKDLERPQRVFQLNVAGLTSDFPPLKSLDTVGSLLTLLMADVTGWHVVMRELGDERMVDVTRAFHALAGREIRHHDGRVFEMVADTVLAGFGRPLDGLHAARALRDVLRTEPWFPGDEPPGVRQAVHSGRIAEPRSGHLGSTAYRCVSMCNGAETGQILVSHATEALLEGEPIDVELRDLGERTLQGFDRPARVFEIA
jgi:class 3 adenylate cyclase